MFRIVVQTFPNGFNQSARRKRLLDYGTEPSELFRDEPVEPISGHQNDICVSVNSKEVPGQLNAIHDGHCDIREDQANFVVPFAVCFQGDEPVRGRDGIEIMDAQNLPA